MMVSCVFVCFFDVCKFVWNSLCLLYFVFVDVAGGGGGGVVVVVVVVVGGCRCCCQLSYCDMMILSALWIHQRNACLLLRYNGMSSFFSDAIRCNTIARKHLFLAVIFICRSSSLTCM